MFVYTHPHNLLDSLFDKCYEWIKNIIYEQVTFYCQTRIRNVCKWYCPYYLRWSGYERSPVNIFFTWRQTCLIVWLTSRRTLDACGTWRLLQVVAAFIRIGNRRGLLEVQEWSVLKKYLDFIRYREKCHIIYFSYIEIEIMFQRLKKLLFTCKSYFEKTVQKVFPSMVRFNIENPSMNCVI